MKVRVFEMPLDFGANRHGSDMGPSAIRLAGLKKTLCALNLEPEEYFSPISINPQEYEPEGNPKVKYLSPIVTACTQLAAKVEQAIDEGAFPLILGGDHSIALGTLAGLSASYTKTGKTLGVLYVDAHGDFNTDETSPSGNIHGMCLAASCGYGIDELVHLYRHGTKVEAKNVCYLGVRSLDEKEKVLMKNSGVTVFTMTDIERLGFAQAVRRSIDFLKKNVDVVHVSFDMDVMDPMFAPGVGIPLQGGLNYREVLFLMEELSQTQLVKSFEVVEVNPVLDVRNQTALMAVEIIGRLLGDRIY